MNAEPSLEQLGTVVRTLAEMVGDPNHGDETFDNYLRFTARLHSYSTRNMLLIMWQCPEASYVASYRQWEALGRQVRRGETGIAIIRPSRRCIGRESRRPQPPGKVEWRVAHVFDASQTIGNAPVPNYRRHLEGDVEQLLAAVAAFAGEQDIAIAHQPMKGPSNGKSLGGSIVLNSNRPEAIQVQTAIHEIAHELLHPLEERDTLTLQQCEIEAESVTTTVLQAFGFDTLSPSAAYIRQHTANAEQVLSSLDRIRSTAHLVIGGLQRHMQVQTARSFTLVSPDS